MEIPAIREMMIAIKTLNEDHITDHDVRKARDEMKALFNCGELDLDCFLSHFFEVETIVTFRCR
jgi:hypothetical protein